MDHISKKTEIKLLESLRSIPRGKVITYGMLAKKFNLNPRHVGWRLSRNGRPDYYPCYKVVRSDLTVGGYTISHKNDRHTMCEKIRRLKEDGVTVVNNRVRKDALYKLR